ncbi:S1 family peptidase [Streptomyces sp. NPDC046261]|uniref:S1 family peptidase n=1 Tax=Streptomyces sp. NPDC046261 TaxID=3157200 RepID=UPI0033D3C8E7
MQPSAPLRRVATLAATALAVVAAVALSPHSAGASAGRPAKVMTPAAAGQLAKSLAPQLKGAAAGSYYDRTAKKLVVNVTTPEAAAKVRKAGAEPRKVQFDDSTLAATMTTLNASEPIPGTAWVPDPRVNKVVVTADPTVKGAKLARLTTVLKPLGEKVKLERTDSELKMFLSGGDPIYGSNVSSVRARCSLGFNVKRSGKPDAFLTAGHCGNPIRSWATSDSGEEIAVTTASSFPGNDYAIAEYVAGAPEHPSEVNLWNGDEQEITAARDAVLNEDVQRSGSTTGLKSGTVTGLNATVNFPEGQVRGLIQTNVCAEPGDSGGPLFSGSDAIGLTSGGTGNCTDGGTTYFQPVVEALTAYGATVG